MQLNIKSYSDNNFYIGEFSHSSFRSHSHNFFELAYVKKGTTVHILDGVKSEVKSGSYFIVDYGKYHSFCEADEEIEVINCLFTAEFIDKSLKNCRSFSEIMKCYLLKYDYNLLLHEPTRTIFSDGDGFVFETLIKMMAEQEEKGAAHLELIRFYLMEIIIKTMRKITDYGKISGVDSIKFIIDFIEENYNQEIKLCDIAKNENYSLAHLSRKFKEKTGMNFSEYLQRTRIRESCRMLINTDKKIIEISFLCGYKDVNNFNKLFKKYTGNTPMHFRKIYSEVK